MATVRDFYDTDFSRVLNAAEVLRLDGGDADAVAVPARVHLDFDTNAKFLSCYLSHDASNASVCRALLAGIERVLAIGAGVPVRFRLPGEAVRSSSELQFAGRLFVYHEDEIERSILQELQNEANSRGVFLQFRGPQFAKERTTLEKPLAFILHDSRDKDEIARPIAVGLSKQMCSVWFDEFSLKVGARLRESIERGLKDAKKCVLLITPNFLSNEGWTKTEFNAIFTRELVEGQDVVLPVWNVVSRQQVFEYSPVLADRVALQWSLGAEEVVRRLRLAIID